MKLTIVMPGPRVGRPKESIEERLAALEAALKEPDPMEIMGPILKKRLLAMRAATCSSPSTQAKIDALMSHFNERNDEND